MLLLSTSSLTWYGIHRIFSFAKKTGYTGLDIALSPLNFDVWDEKYLKDLSDVFDLPIVSITAPSKGMSSSLMDKIISLAHYVGAQMITVSPPHITDKDSKWFGERIKKISQESHISINVQNVESKFLFFVIPEYRNASLEKIKSVTGSTTLDVLALEWSAQWDLNGAYEVLGSSLKNVFFCDKQGIKRWILPGSAGGGISFLPLESFLMRLKTSGYDGYITLKVNPSEIGAGNEERILQNLEYMHKYYKKHFKEYV